ncbi:MAG: hypothetical protein GOVbin2669_37 [Prokaryotic dsDNA virus sp.]|nr:MAG: hypothetical protein GOVbin2669_37 [Prokaryotic dsDNA virus sp.]|tara:strand:+ start:9894 stop:10403 length:510 start_codon:yes stop_codon:yes gene_type:complete
MSVDSIRYKTYNNVVDTLKCLGQQHLQINTTTTGDIWDIDLDKNTLFPLLHIEPVNVDISLGQRVFNYQIFIMDLVNEDNSNEQEVYSDTLEILNDIIALLKHGEILYHYNTEDAEQARYFIDNNFTCEPFTERFDNAVAGWVMSLGVIVENELNTCNIPIDNTTICVK